MISLKEAIHNKPTFDKVAEYELPKDVSEWNEDILKQFYKDVSYLPKEMSADIVVDNVDENKGYAKGSVVVFFNKKQINFPIVVNDFKLSPFDVFVHNDDGKLNYYSANISNIKKVLSSDKMGKLENYWGKGSPSPDVKSPGGIYPKQSVDVASSPSQDQSNPGFLKISSWVQLAKKEDLEKLAIQMEAQPDVGASFVDNTGDLIGNVIEMKDNEKRIIADDHKEGVLDLKNVVTAKKAVTAIDYQMTDVSDLNPIKPPTVCELRLYQYPSMEDFLESGDNMAGRFMASKVGKPVVGVVLDCNDYDESDSACPPYGGEDKPIRNRRDQIFLSACGCYYSKFNDYSKTGIGFYGSKVLETEGSVEKAVGMISKNSSDEFTNHNRDNRNDGADKSFHSNKEMSQGKGNDRYGKASCWSTRLLAIYGAGDAWECMEFGGNYKKYRVNDSNVYVSDNVAIIPANVATIQKVSSVDDPVYKMIVGKAKNIFLVPEGAVILNTEYMKRMNVDDFMRPDKSVQKTFEDAAIKKVAVYVSPVNEDTLGYQITGQPIEPLKKIAGINGRCFTTNETLFALQVMGMEKDASVETLKVAMNRYSDSENPNKSVVIYGVNDDYINPNIFAEREKTAKVKELYKKYAYELRRDLVKEASALQDPEAADVVLSLNFINEDSLASYVENIEEMKRISSELAKMLIASRMGLSELDESALKKAIVGLDEVVAGLENLKMATSQD